MYTIKKEDFSSSEMMQQLVNLQNKVYAGKHVFTSDTFKHWYLDNPNGEVVSFNAFYEDVIVAHYALVPVQMCVDNKIVDGLLSMATVTDPEHQGKGLFKLLAKETFEYSKSCGYKFVIGVANANSYPGFIKYFNFVDLGKLDVLIGINNSIKADGFKTYSMHWSDKALSWRIARREYLSYRNNIYGSIGFGPFKKLWGIKTFMGCFTEDKIKAIGLKERNVFGNLKLYIGIGSNAKSKGYVPVPKFIKRSPFHLIFLDMSNGELPEINKGNIFFQLIDYDVA